MPLVPRDGGDHHRIEITADIDPHSVGDWYTIKTQLGWWDREKASAAQGVTLNLPYGRATAGQIDPEELVPVTLERQAHVAFQKLSVWLVEWSHKEPISANTIKRIPQSHAREILRAIGRFERQQEGPGEDSPLPASSNGSSGTSSSTPSPPKPTDGSAAWAMMTDDEPDTAAHGSD